MRRASRASQRPLQPVMSGVRTICWVGSTYSSAPLSSDVVSAAGAPGQSAHGDAELACLDSALLQFVYPDCSMRRPTYVPDKPPKMRPSGAFAQRSSNVTKLATEMHPSVSSSPTHGADAEGSKPRLSIGWQPDGQLLPCSRQSPASIGDDACASVPACVSPALAAEEASRSSPPQHATTSHAAQTAARVR